MNEERVEPIPSGDDLLWPVLKAFQALGGSATNSEVDDQVIQSEGFTEAQQAIPISDNNEKSRLAHRLGWTRFHLKNAGYLENPRRGLCVLTPAGQSATDEAEVRATVKQATADFNRRTQEQRQAHRRGSRRSLGAADGSAATPSPDGAASDDDALADSDDSWIDAVLERLSTVSPAGFERLTTRLLRLAGFEDVDVLGGPSDGGIDGVGILKVSLISFPVYFQCKRYKGVVGPSVVRDFRGAMTGRGDKGLLITTGTFTREARAEATRDGVPPVDLISGPELAELLRKHGMGIKTQTVVTVDTDYFNQYD